MVQITKSFLTVCVVMIFCSSFFISEVDARYEKESLLEEELTGNDLSEKSDNFCSNQRSMGIPENPDSEIQYVDCTSEAYGFNQGRDFFSDTLLIMEIPVSEFAVDAFMIWKPYENTYACWNPLATTRKVAYLPPSAGCTSTDFNSVGVKNYSSKYCGELATASTLNLSYYTAIRTMLRQEAFNWDAIKASVKTWVGSESYATSITNKWLTLWNNRSTADVTPPVSTLSLSSTGLGENGWFTAPVTARISASDDSSGVSYSEYDINATGVWVRYSEPFTLAVVGVYYIHYRSVDVAGNVETHKTSVVSLDSQQPLNPTTAYPNCDAQSGVLQNTCNHPHFYWEGHSDSGSQVAGFNVYWGVDPFGTNLTWTETTFFDAPPVSDGIYYFRLRTKDWAGNYSAWNTQFILVYSSSVVQLFLPMLCNNAGNESFNIVPTIISPADGEFVNNLTPTFTWQINDSLHQSTWLYYWISEDPNLSYYNYSGWASAGQGFAQPELNLQPNTTYYWYAAYDYLSGDFTWEIGPKTEVRSFRTGSG